MVDWLAGNRVRGTSTERTTSTGFNGGFTGTGGWKELARTTLGSASHPITVSSLPDKRYYMVLAHNTAGGAINWNFRVGTGGTLDTGSNYADRHSQNGAGDNTTAPANRWGDFLSNASIDRFSQLYISNLSGKEKLMTGHVADSGGTGAGSAPERVEVVGKWTNTSLIDVLSLQDDNSQNFGSGSEMVVLGWDPDDTHTTNFWEELASVELGSASNSISTGTFTAKKYLWIQCYVPSSTGSADNYVIRVGNSTIDSGSNYSQRYNINGGAQGSGTQVNQDKIRLSFNIASGSEWFFANSFIINNSGNEKLLISHANRNSTTGAGTAPSRYEMTGKWANTSNQINIIDLLHQNSSSSLGAGTIIKVWGHD